MERTTVENLKELIRAGRAKTPATKVIMGGTLVMLCLRRSIRQISQFTKTRL